MRTTFCKTATTFRSARTTFFRQTRRKKMARTTLPLTLSPALLATASCDATLRLRLAMPTAFCTAHTMFSHTRTMF